MPVSYNKLWKLLIDKKMNKVQFKNRIGIGSNTLAKLGKDEHVSMGVMEKICSNLNCNFGDIIDFVDDKENGLDE